MARIRSIKPDYWKSESIAKLSLHARLTFIGLWTYVDDNGVGRDNGRLITAEVFPLEDDPVSTLAHVHRSLDELAAGGRITRYTVDDKAFLAVTGWSEHQKIDRPGKPRYPGPDDPAAMPVTCAFVQDEGLFDAPSRALAAPHRVSAASHAPEQGAGSREQGAGSTEQGDSVRGAKTRPKLVDVSESSASAVVAAYIEGSVDSGKPRPSGRLIGKVGKDGKRLLSEGVPVAELIEAARRCGASGWDDLDRERQRPQRGKPPRDISRFTDEDYRQPFGNAS